MHGPGRLRRELNREAVRGLVIQRVRQRALIRGTGLLPVTLKSGLMMAMRLNAATMFVSTA